MDFLKDFDAVSAAEQTTPLEIRNQATGEVITRDGDPCIVLVKTLQCAAVVEIDRQEKREAMAEAMRRDDVDPGFDLDQIEARARRKAAALIGGFENMATVGPDGQPRPLTVDDAEAFVALNRFSEAHMWRKVLPVTRSDGETDDAFAARKAEIDAAWLEPSFAQQIIDYAEALPRFLGGCASA